VSQSRTADAAPPGALPAHRGARSALDPRNWRVAPRLIALVTIPVLLGLALTGLRVTAATRSSEAYGQVGRLAVLSQQVTGLAQAMESERAGTAAFIGDGRPAAGLVTLRRQYAITDGWAATVRPLARQLGRGYPAQTRASAAKVLASIAELADLRRQAAQSQDPALAVINTYSAATAGLFPLIDAVADLSGNSVLISSVRALGSLSMMKDQASRQQAILGAALAEGRFEPGALPALTIAQAQQASDVVSFRGSATPEESWALTKTLASPLAGQARAVEQQASGVGDGTLAPSALARQQWAAGMSSTVGWMRHAEQQLATWITAYARALQRSAMRSAITTGGAALAVLILILLAALIIARSIVRPLRRLEAGALAIAGTRLPAEVRALGMAGGSEPAALVAPIDVLSTDEIGQAARAVDRLHREAVRLAGEEAQLRGSVSAVFAGFFRRSSSLQERLLWLIDSLELGEDDPERLAGLFRVDQLATQMRRNSDSALVLAGHETSRPATGSITLADVLRAAVSEIGQYDRVTVDVQLSGSVSGRAAADTVHLLAELLENATTFSPAATQVIVSGYQMPDGSTLFDISDQGTGIPEEQLRQLNRQLAHPSLADGTVARHIGLFAVAHLAARHGIEVVLVHPPAGGTTAEVHLPATLISLAAGPGGGADALPEAEDPPPTAPWVAARPEFALGPTIAMSDALAPTLGAPVPSPAPATSSAVTGPEPAGEEPTREEPASEEPASEEPGDPLPIFESVEWKYFPTRDPDPLSSCEPQAD
jgi:signal transduction histidine kinase